jgi:hypothetical protein
MKIVRLKVESELNINGIIKRELFVGCGPMETLDMQPGNE